MCRTRTCQVTALTYCTRTPTADGHAVNTHFVRVLILLLCLICTHLLRILKSIDLNQLTNEWEEEEKDREKEKTAAVEIISACALLLQHTKQKSGDFKVPEQTHTSITVQVL
ncbi:hypothetical protein GQX74_011864 [Glossina fuscipes]|nr:hypothetical protein GQX74_011864 [Glossina fuscipes]